MENMKINTVHYINVMGTQISLTDYMQNFSDGRHLIYARYEGHSTWTGYNHNYFLSKSVKDMHSSLIAAFVIQKKGNNFKIINMHPCDYDMCCDCPMFNECFIRDLSTKCFKFEEEEKE